MDRQKWLRRSAIFSWSAIAFGVLAFGGGLVMALARQNTQAVPQLERAIALLALAAIALVASKRL